MTRRLGYSAGILSCLLLTASVKTGKVESAPAGEQAEQAIEAEAPPITGGLGSRPEHGSHVLGTRSATRRELDIRHGRVEPTEEERLAIEAKKAARWNMAAIGEPALEGDLDPAVVFDVIAADHDGLRYCYQKQHYLNPALVGDVTVAVDLDPDGTVAGVEIAPLLEGGEDLQQCVRARFMRLRFPATASGDRFEVSVSFRPPE